MRMDVSKICKTTENKSPYFFYFQATGLDRSTIRITLVLTSAKTTSGISRFKRNQFLKNPQIMITNILAGYLEIRTSFKYCLKF